MFASCSGTGVRDELPASTRFGPKEGVVVMGTEPSPRAPVLSLTVSRLGVVKFPARI